MSYKSLKEAALDLEKTNQLRRICIEVDPDLEMAEIHRRVYEAGGPALLFEKVKDSPFPALSNLYGTPQRTDFLFRKTIQQVEKVIRLKIDPIDFLKKPLHYWSAPFTALKALPLRIPFRWSPMNYRTTTIDKLPQIKSWSMDGGAFITLPQVYTEDPDKKGIMGSNIGMYRIQLSGNQYIMNEEVGLHYQIHRGIGVHHEKYNRRDEPFKCSIFVGGPPSHALAAIFPLPEGLPEVTFAGMLNGRRFRYSKQNEHVISSDADFCITGTILRGTKKPEGPFGDHLGYYSLKHDFPVMRVEKVYHRRDAIWHFTVVGRPPAEDSSFGYMIHKLVKPLTPQEFPGVTEIHAVDAAGVHPLLLAIGKERYMPFRERKPEEILTIANRILGSGQTSLAKFLFIAAEGDAEDLTTKDIRVFFNHFLERVDWTRDLHFQTRTTIDTLDYSGSGWNEGSKVVLACCGAPRRTLKANLPKNFTLPAGMDNPKFIQQGILAIRCPPFSAAVEAGKQAELLCKYLENFDLRHIPLILMVDDSDFAAATLQNFVWVTFTRANPSHDIYGVHAFTAFKHWGCRGALVIDARVKPHHAPMLIPDKKVTEKIDKLFIKGGALEGLI
ncbi:MAG: UbiD family decarboxylase [Bacteroidota bacterium]|jgi:4-hydroxy-3-polyprenylbenzoate decarboxylase